VELSERSLLEIIEMQEDIHWGIGRNRRKVSIGLHDLDKVTPPFAYVAATGDKRFVPLDGEEEMSLIDVLVKHEKGRAYGHILAGASRYPLIVDAKKRVMSFPPIINSELTRVTDRTRNLFIDVTGTDLEAVKKGLNVLVTTLYDMGANIERVTVAYRNLTIKSPDLKPSQMKLRSHYARQLLGLDLTDDEVALALERSRLGVKKIRPGLFRVFIPAYRIDVMHEVDLVEDVLIGYGCYKLKPSLPATITTGTPHKSRLVANVIRQIMVGLGFTEVVNFTLTNEESHYIKLRLNVGKALKIANPVSSEYSIIRESLLPGLMSNLAINKRESLPQRLFEVSNVVELDPKSETSSRRKLHVAGIVMDFNANFTQIKSYVEALLTNLGAKNWKIREGKHESFIPGRVGVIVFKGKSVGVMGEVHPEVINNFDLENPACAFEIDISRLLNV
jgi:phenylalanyl-tRNA synthetase beta chain